MTFSFNESKEKLRPKKEQEECSDLVKVSRDGLELQYITNQTYELCVAAVNNNPDALKYAKIKTEEFYCEVVAFNSKILLQIEKQSDKICLASLTRGVRALEYMREQNPLICLIAISQCATALKYIRKPTQQMIDIALLKEPDSYMFLSNKPTYVDRVKSTLGRIGIGSK